MSKQEQGSLTKQGMINLIREMHGLTAEEARGIVETIVYAMRDSVISNGYLSIKDFGTFTVVERVGRVVNHPATQQPVRIPTGWGLRFNMAEALRRDVKNISVKPFPSK